MARALHFKQLVCHERHFIAKKHEGKNVEGRKCDLFDVRQPVEKHQHNKYVHDRARLR